MKVVLFIFSFSFLLKKKINKSFEIILTVSVCSVVHCFRSEQTAKED